VAGEGDDEEGEAELAIEVTPTERGIVTVGEAEACLRQAMACRLTLTLFSVLSVM
jgi:hypothetical protein